MQTLILKVLVGSKAHGLANKDSDTDYRGVFVESTSEILAMKKLTIKKVEPNLYEISNFASYKTVTLFATAEELEELHQALENISCLDENCSCYIKAMS
ncbi:nucleotidyltransferase domain-containing protein [Candidatus Daviesbacteria bacterium]|nr:nucleotidyltransferase domain-containing protein [Candidatus Daviesbacteria bacterium]